jgi:phosphopantetheine--protein transferase-like protein
MRRNDSDWINDVFGARVRNWTPAPVRQAACALYVPYSSSAEITSRCATVLSGSERLQAERFVTEKDRAHFTQRRAFRRYCSAFALGSAEPLSHTAFAESEKGRPYLPDRPDIWFSFSSCRLGFLGAWSSTHAIGVDLEDRSRSLEALELAQMFFSQAEAKAIADTHGPQRLRAFFQFWALKEAALKSIGEGLPFGLDVFAFELTPAPRIVQVPDGEGRPEKFDAHVIEDGNCCAALVIRERNSRPQAQSDGSQKGADTGAEVS